MEGRLSRAIIVSFLTLAAAIPRPAQAAAEERARSVGNAFVLIRVEGSAPKWKARAIQEFISLNLAGMDRIRVADSFELKDLNCLELDLDCIMAELRVRGVQIFIRGSLDNQELRIASHETWAGSEIASRTLKLGRGVTLTDFRHRVFRVIRPFTEIGGLLDQHPAPLARAAGPQPEGPPPIDERALWRLAVISVILALLFWAPTFVTQARVPGMRRYLTAISLLIPAILFLCVHVKLTTGALVPARLSPAVTILKFWLGGAGWASIVVIAHRFAFSGLRGLDRATYFTIFPILRAWFSVSIWKLFVFVVALWPFLAAGLQVAHLLALAQDTSLTLAAPISILLGCLWYLVWIAYLASHLDGEFLLGTPLDRKRWDAEVRKYFSGYLRRLDIHVNERLLKRTLFLPGKIETVLSYGGGWTRPRVVVNETLLRLALGPLPIEERLEAGERGFADYVAGTLKPKRRRKAGSVDDDEGWAFIERARDFVSGLRIRKTPTDTAVRAQAGPAFNLHNANVLGYVIPSTRPETEALAADNREDLDALGELLTAHYAQFAKDGDQEGYELDDSDPTDRDFLFGALLREQGVLDLRQEILGSFSIAFVHACRHLPMFLGQILSFLKDIYGTGFSKYPDLLADSYAALNSGRHHLTQHIYFQLTGYERMLTTRGDETLLYATSTTIFSEVGAISPTKEDALPLRSTLRNRLIWLSEFFYRPLPHESSAWLRQLSMGALLITVLIVVHHFVHESIEYDHVYTARMEEARRKIVEQEKKQNGDNPDVKPDSK